MANPFPLYESKLAESRFCCRECGSEEYHDVTSVADVLPRLLCSGCGTAWLVSGFLPTQSALVELLMDRAPDPPVEEPVPAPAGPIAVRRFEGLE